MSELSYFVGTYNTGERVIYKIKDLDFVGHAGLFGLKEISAVEFLVLQKKMRVVNIDSEFAIWKHLRRKVDVSYLHKR